MSETYKDYHARVIEECVKLMGEHTLSFFDKRHDFTVFFERRDTPEQVAQHFRESYGGNDGN